MKTMHTATLAATLATAVLLVAPSLTMAQTTTKATKPAATSTKPAEKPAAKKKPAVSANRTNLKSAAKNVAAGIEAAEAALTPAELAIAERVQVGNLPCELGASVTLVQDAKAPGYFDMQGKNFKYRLFPVLTSTGAIRLEDQKAGAVWLQLANKSMLMNQKLGIRLADECMSPAQMVVAENLKINPPPSILDAPKPVAIPTAIAAVEPPAVAPTLPAPAAR
ncbi:MAG TPA: hypothetical protein VFW43_00910 [Polaromonas sp.]|nr:hypothetical protein [Polaromonas sp.]